jgi:hypothetical protein
LLLPNFTNRQIETDGEYRAAWAGRSRSTVGLANFMYLGTGVFLGYLLLAFIPQGVIYYLGWVTAGLLVLCGLVGLIKGARQPTPAMAAGE